MNLVPVGNEIVIPSNIGIWWVNLKVRIFVYSSYHLSRYWHSKPYLYMDDFTLNMKVLAWYIDLNGIENKDIVKHSNPIGI